MNHTSKTWREEQQSSSGRRSGAPLEVVVAVAAAESTTSLRSEAGRYRRYPAPIKSESTKAGLGLLIWVIQGKEGN
jgi:hypothetical protein